MTILRACLAALLGVMLGVNVLAQNGGSSTMLDTLFAKLQTATDPMADPVAGSGDLGAVDHGARCRSSAS